jgi:hypothetical protein
MLLELFPSHIFLTTREALVFALVSQPGEKEGRAVETRSD